MITFEPPRQQEVNVGDLIDWIGIGTVMTPTEELRAMLDERGVEWKAPASYDGSTKYDTIVGDYWFHEYDGGITVHGLTPEQAIAATLGGDNSDTVNRLMKLRGGHYSWPRLYEAVTGDPFDYHCSPSKSEEVFIEKLISIVSDRKVVNE
jgi:hypothetical protein